MVKPGFSKLSMNSSAAKTSWCSQIYNLWAEKEQKLSSLRYLILRKLCHIVEKNRTSWEQKWKRFLSHFHSCASPWRTWRLKRSHIRRISNYNSKIISIIYSDNTRRNSTVDHILEEPSFCTFFFHHISYSVFLWLTLIVAESEILKELHQTLKLLLTIRLKRLFQKLPKVISRLKKLGKTLTCGACIWNFFVKCTI